MTASVTSPEDVVNLALVRIGYKGRIANIYDGSAASNLALNIYAQTRDEFLRQTDFDFAERNIVMTLQKSAPAGGYFPPTAWDPAVNPPLPWYFQYAYPSDCLKVRAIKGAPMFVLDFDPQPVVFSITHDDTLSPPDRAVLCNVSSAVLTYTAQITDLTTWDVGSIDAFAAALGRRLAPATAGLDAAKLAAVDENVTAQIAEREFG